MFRVKNWVRIMLILCVVSLFLLGALGCGTSEEETVKEEEEETVEEETLESGDGSVEEDSDEPEEDEPTIAIDEWRNPTGVSEIVNNFEKMEWTWARLENGKEADSTVVSYQFVGEDNVDGVSTEVLVFAIDAEEITFWVAEEGEILQAEVEGEIIPGEFIDMALEGIDSAIFWPFWTIEEFGIHDALVEATPGIDWSIISTEDEQFGDISAEVTRLEVDLRPPIIPEGEEGIATWGVGDFGEFQMLVEWGWHEVAGEEDLAVQYNLSEIVPR